MKRESNIELLRLLCMFLIVVNHMVTIYFSILPAKK